MADLAADISNGKIDFDQCIATTDAMPTVRQVARILGPRNLMPNPKNGTITDDVEAGVTAILKGKTTFRVDKAGYVHSAVGKVSFSDEKLLDNIQAVMATLYEAKPPSAKGQYLKVRVCEGGGHGSCRGSPASWPRSRLVLASRVAPVWPCSSRHHTLAGRRVC